MHVTEVRPSLFFLVFPLSTADAVRGRVRACISVLGHQAIPEIEASTGLRSWFKEVSQFIVVVVVVIVINVGAVRSYQVAGADQLAPLFSSTALSRHVALDAPATRRRAQGRQAPKKVRQRVPRQ